MRRIVSFIIWIMIVAAVAHFLAIQEGSTQIDWLGWRIAAPTSLLIAVMLIVIWAVLILDRLLSFVANIPRRISGGFSSRRGRLGQRALALGMAAAAAGEGRDAIKHARKSVHYLGHNVMTDLLMAQASSLSGNTKSAQRYFDALKSNTDTAYFGHIGQMRLALEAKNEHMALAAGREALKLKPRSASIANAIFVMEAKQGHWAEAEAALRIASKGHLPASHHAEAAILLERARLAESLSEKMKILNRALKVDGDFLPAVLALADLYLEENKTRKATALLERVFLSTPHPMLAEKLMKNWSGPPAKKLARLIKLAEKGGEQKEGLFAAASIAFEQQLWGEAERLAKAISHEERDARVWQLLADIADHQPASGSEDGETSASILRQAALAPRPPGWTCQACHSRLEDYHAICPNCSSFAQMSWR